MWTERFIILLRPGDRSSDEEGTVAPQKEKPTIICEWPAFLCYTGECIDASGLCNGVLDCPMGEDESPECGETTTIIFALVSMSIGTIFALLFMYMYYLRIKMLEEDVFVTPGGDTVTDADRRYIRLVEIALRNTMEAEGSESVEYVQEGCANTEYSTTEVQNAIEI